MYIITLSPCLCFHCTVEWLLVCMIQVLDHCNASPKDYKCIFTSGATAALKLVGEAFPWSSESNFMYTMENHNSVLGIREYPNSFILICLDSWFQILGIWNGIEAFFFPFIFFGQGNINLTSLSFCPPYTCHFTDCHLIGVISPAITKL